MRAPGCRGNVQELAVVLALVSAFGLYDERTPLAFNYVIDINGTYWGIQDDNSRRYRQHPRDADRARRPGGTLQHGHQWLWRDPGAGADGTCAVSER